MPEYNVPGVYVEEISTGAKPIEGVSTAVAAIVGVAPKGDAYVNEPRECNSWDDFRRDFTTEESKATNLAYAVRGYFENGGRRLYVLNLGPTGTLGGDARKGTGIHALESYDEPSMIAAPGFTTAADYTAMLDFAKKRGDIFAILDGPEKVDDIKYLTEVATVDGGGADAEGGGGRRAARSKGCRPPDDPEGRAACYFPWIYMTDPFGGREPVVVPPSGHIAGIYASNDYRRGVHKAPANYRIATAEGVKQRLTREQQGVLNAAGINCIRFFGTTGILVWGARTLSVSNPEWRYVNVRRLFNFLEESIANGTRWVVFEPHDQITRNSVARDCRAFLKLQWLAGALVGATPEQAFFVKCDAENNPPEVVDAGRLIIDIGVAPSKPAEFVIFRIGQWSGGTEIQAA